MSFGQDFLKGFFGADGLKDYAHASKTFRSNGYQNAPRFKYLFHVYFTINTSVGAIRSLFNNVDVATIGLLVKSVTLPSFSMKLDTLNQYNRKRLVQTRIEYEPVTIEFHDDGGDLVRSMWANYYAYYFKDSQYKYGNLPAQNGSAGVVVGTNAGFDYNSRDIYAATMPQTDWGYIGESYSDGNGSGVSGKPAFFKDIRVYGMSQHKWAEYVMINPMINSWKHDTYNYSEGGGIMGHTMVINYETVKYYSGAIGSVRPDTNVVGFADPAYYDTIPSALARPGSTATVLGQGGLIDAGIGIVQDLSAGSVAGLIGAVQKAGATYNTFKGKDIASIALTETKQAVKQVLKQSLPGVIRPYIGTSTSKGSLDGIFFPTPPKTVTPGTITTKTNLL